MKALNILKANLKNTIEVLMGNMDFTQLQKIAAADEACGVSLGIMCGCLFEGNDLAANQEEV